MVLVWVLTGKGNMSSNEKKRARRTSARCIFILCTLMLEARVEQAFLPVYFVATKLMTDKNVCPSSPIFNSLRYLGAFCDSAVSDLGLMLTAEAQRTQRLRRKESVELVNYRRNSL
jgi:hypothetical protein